MKALFFGIALTASSVAVQAEQHPTYLCEVKASGGLAHEGGEWKSVHFNPDMKYVVKWVNEESAYRVFIFGSQHEIYGECIVDTNYGHRILCEGQGQNAFTMNLDGVGHFFVSSANLSIQDFSEPRWTRSTPLHEYGICAQL